MHITQARDQNEIISQEQKADYLSDQDGHKDCFEPSAHACDEHHVADDQQDITNHLHTQQLDLRCCVVSGAEHPKDEMLRFVVSPTSELVYDCQQNLPADSIWVAPSKANLENAIKKGLFSEIAKTDVTVRDDLYEHVISLIRQNLFNTLCMANRAGEIAAGLDQCLILLRNGNAGLYVTASEVGSDARNRIQEKNPDLTVIDYLSDHELGRIIGSPQLTHMIVKSGNLCLKGQHWHTMLLRMER